MESAEPAEDARIQGFAGIGIGNDHDGDADGDGDALLVLDEKAKKSRRKTAAAAKTTPETLSPTGGEDMAEEVRG